MVDTIARATALDAAAEWYFAENSILALACSTKTSSRFRSGSRDPSDFIFSLWRYVIASEHGTGTRSATVQPSVELLIRMFLTGNTAELAATSQPLSAPVERAL